MITLIQGFFFTSDELEPGDPRVFVRDTTSQRMFSGLFGPEREDPLVLVGKMSDDFGKSVLTNIVFENDVLQFLKHYTHRNDVIEYQLKKYTDGTWRGTFAGKKVGDGQAHCIITSVPRSFLLPVPFETEKANKAPSERAGIGRLPTCTSVITD